MTVGANRLILVLTAFVLLTVPALAMHSGPGALNSNNELTVEYGCSCHNNGAPSDRAVVMITGVPLMYEISKAYNFTITVADSLTLSGGNGNSKGGFLLSSNGSGQFSWEETEEIRQALDRPDDISHSDTDSDGIWEVSWTAPSEDIGPVQFWLAGNSVDGGGIPDEMDYWNLLSFSVNSPGAISDSESASILETRTISVGTYDALFLLEKSPEEIEQERQDAISERVFFVGNKFFWTSLVALIVGAVFQKEILERRPDQKGPEFLAAELAYPQGFWRAFISAVSFFFAVRWMASDSPITFQGVDFSTFLTGTAFFVGFWAAYGVYRTVLSARQDPNPGDIM